MQPREVRGSLKGKNGECDESRPAKIVAWTAGSTKHPDQRKHHTVKAQELRSVRIELRRNVQNTQKIRKPPEENQDAYHGHAEHCRSNFEISQIPNLVRWIDCLGLLRRLRHLVPPCRVTCISLCSSPCLAQGRPAPKAFIVMSHETHELQECRAGRTLPVGKSGSRRRARRSLPRWQSRSARDQHRER